MGASAREIEQQIKGTRDRMDENISVVEGRAARGAKRYGKIAAAVLAVAGVASGAYLIWRRTRKAQPRTLERVFRKVAPAVVATAATGLLRRVTAPPSEEEP